MPPIKKKDRKSQKVDTLKSAFDGSELTICEEEDIVFEDEESLTHGTFGFLRPVYHKGQRCMVRQVLEEPFKKRYWQHLDGIHASFVRDIMKQASMRHPNLASPFAVVCTPLSAVYEHMEFRLDLIKGLSFGQDKPQPCLTLADFLGNVREYDLYTHIDQLFLNDLQAQIAMDVANGLAYLHAHELTHNSLVPESIVMSNHPSLRNSVLCKLIDYGKAYLDVNAVVSQTTSTDELKKCMESDVQSYGAVLKMLLTPDDDDTQLQNSFESGSGSENSMALAFHVSAQQKEQDLSTSFEIYASTTQEDGKSQLNDKKETHDTATLTTDDGVEPVTCFVPLEVLVRLKDACMGTKSVIPSMTHLISIFIRDFQTRTQVVCDGSRDDPCVIQGEWKCQIESQDTGTQMEKRGLQDFAVQAQVIQVQNAEIQISATTVETHSQVELEMKNAENQTSQEKAEIDTQTISRMEDKSVGFHPETTSTAVQDTVTYADCETQMLFKYAVLRYCRVLEAKERTMPKQKLPVYENKVNHRHKSRICIADHQMPSPCLDPERIPRTILMIGATGSGKSTLIDGLINYIYGVDWEDDFRLSIIDIKEDEQKMTDNQAKSQTQWVTTYVVQPAEGSNIESELKIVDMPGFGDTEGIQKDDNLVERLEQIFALPEEEGGIQQLDLVCFVVQASLGRLTASQKYILTSLESVFDKSISENIVVLVTFADGKEPEVLQALAENNTPFRAYFTFNNSGLFALNTAESSNDKFAKMFWEMGAASYKAMIQKVQMMETKSLQLSKEVLDKRRRMKLTISLLRRKVNEGLITLENLIQEKKILKQRIAEVHDNRNFEYEVTQQHYEAVPKDDGAHTTNCLKCNMSCHYPCYLADNADKRNCAAMNGKGAESECRVCPGKCSWQDHRNDSHFFKLETKTVKKTYFDMKTRYEEALSERSSLEEIICVLTQDFEETQKEVEELIDQIIEYTNALNKLALVNHPPITRVGYLKMAIEAEQRNKQPGFQNRVQMLTDALEETEMLQEGMGTGEFNPWGKYMEEPELFEEVTQTKRKGRLMSLKRFAIKTWNMIPKPF